jgi:hypothetical protein
MAQIKPLYLRPVVGYAMWHLDRGLTAEEVYGKLRDSKEYAGIRGDLLRLAISRAETNLAGTARLALTRTGDVIGSAFPHALRADEPVGVRIVFEPGIVDINLKQPSITVNAPAGMSIAEVFARAMEYAERVQLLQGPSRERMDIEYTPHVMQLIEGGLSAPALDLMGGGA